MDSSLRDALVGRELDGRYLVRSRIARGGMATVYLALDRRLDRETAIKVMHEHLADDEQFSTRFRREARSAARLSHPNVVQVFDQGDDGDLLYLAMEYLPGRTLRDVLGERGVLTPREAMVVFEPIVDALAAAHRAGIVHRDVKPENVILTDDGRVKVADFGLARAATASPSAGGATNGVLLGTVAYLAPELVAEGTADPRSDVYAAGIVLFEMLTGRQPFTGDVPIQVAYRHVHEDVPPPSSVVPGLPPALDALVRLATSRDPAERPADAGELLAGLRSARSSVAEDELDRRPGRPGTGAAPGDATSVVAPSAATPQPTQTLSGPPPLPSRRRLRETAAGAPGTSLLASGVRPVNDDDLAEFETDPERAATLLRRRRVLGTAGLVAVVALALSLALGAWYFAAGPGAYVDTPSLAGMTAEDAGDTLDGRSLRSREEQVYSDDVAVGTVVSTDPGAGERVRKDGTVVLNVSRGPENVTVPELVGLPLEEATAALEEAYLELGQVEETYDDEDSGTVLSADPGEGTALTNGDTVDLTVSKGPEPVQVPDVVGRSKDDAANTLSALGLGITYGDPVYDDSVPADAVVSQDPSSGELTPGESVTVVLSKGPEQVTVPDVLGKSVDEARAELEAAGFQVEENAFFGGRSGVVRAQSVSGGDSAPKGATITITVV